MLLSRLIKSLSTKEWQHCHSKNTKQFSTGLDLNAQLKLQTNYLLRNNLSLESFLKKGDILKVQLWYQREQKSKLIFSTKVVSAFAKIKPFHTSSMVPNPSSAKVKCYPPPHSGQNQWQMKGYYNFYSLSYSRQLKFIVSFVKVKLICVHTDSVLFLPSWLGVL